MFEDIGAEPPRRRIFPAFSLTRIVRGIAKNLLNWAPDGSVMIVLPNGERVRFGEAGHHAEPVLRIRSYRVIRKAITRGTLGFAQAYIDRDIDVAPDDLVELFRFFVRNQARLRRSGMGLFRVARSDLKSHKKRRNSKTMSRKNITEHYDLGNAFFSKWLDAEMQYSSGVYENDTDTLETAQARKFDLLLDMMAPREGARILEIGCGWGGLARHAANRVNASVDGLTLSHEQRAWAEDAAIAAGLDDQLKFELRDYRDSDGQYDHIMSVEMIEAVGEEYWPTYFATLRQRLKPGGTAVIQAITIDAARYQSYRRSTDFIQRYIFPGGMLPTDGIIHAQAEAAGLEVVETRCFGPSYARTLREWRARFDAAWKNIEPLGFDDRFRRLWTYYLTYCEAGFDLGMIDVGAYKLVRQG